MLGINVKRRLYKGVAVPTALYGTETWSMAVAEKKRLKAMEMRRLRSICGVTHMNRVRNKEVQRKTGVTRVGWSSGENGGESVGEEKGRIQCEGVRLRGRPRV